MKLKQWLRVKKMGTSEFARLAKIEVRCVRDYVAGRAIPRHNVMVKIYRFTDGEVQPNDFYRLPRPRKLQSNDAMWGVVI